MNFFSFYLLFFSHTNAALKFLPAEMFEANTQNLTAGLN